MPLVLFILLMLCVHDAKIKPNSWLYAACVSIGITGSIVIASTMFLSFLNAFNTFWVWISWLLIILSTTLIFRKKIFSESKKLIRDFSQNKPRITSPYIFGLIVIIGLFCTGTLASALLYPVRTWDGLWSIMPRISFWIQNQNVKPFFTPIGQQLTTYPLDAYFIAHIKLLSGGSDKFVNLIQWTAYCGSIILTFGLSRLLGASQKSSLIASLVAASSPIVILEATTTQYDLFVGLYCLAAVYLCISFINSLQSSSEFPKYIFYSLGCIIGVGLNAKITFLIVLFPFLCWALYILFKQTKLKYIKQICISVCIAIVLSAPWFGQNMIAHKGDMFAINVQGNNHVLIKSWQPQDVLANMVRGVMTPLGTPSVGVNKILEFGIISTTKLIGVNVLDKKDMEQKDIPFHLSTEITNNDSAPSPVTMIVFFMSLIVLIFKRRTMPPKAILYILSGLFGYFAISTLVSWQPYIVRTLIPSELAMMPIVALSIDAANLNIKRIFYCAVLIGAALGLVVTIWNSNAPLISQKYRPLHPGESVGFWNSSRIHLSFRYSVPEIENDITKLAALTANQSKKASIAVTGSAWFGFPIYLLQANISNSTLAYVDENRIKASQPYDYIVETSFTSEKLDQRPFYKIILQTNVPSNDWIITTYKRVSR